MLLLIETEKRDSLLFCSNVMERMLSFGDGTSWALRASGETRAWAEEFASIMGMREADRTPDSVLRVVRVAPAPGREKPSWWSPPQGLPRGGWRVRLSPGLELWSRPEMKETIGVIGRYPDRESAFLQMRYALYPLYEDTVLRDGLPVHAALLERGGRGVLLAGRSGIGKSTACSRIPPPWKALGDDMALVVRAGDKQYLAHPLPTWSTLSKNGSARTWDVGRSVPLDAVFFLVQAGEDEAVPAGGGAAAVMLDRAAMMVLRSVEAHSEPFERTPLRTKIFESAASLAASVPCFVLRLSLTGRFWEKIEEALA